MKKKRREKIEISSEKFTHIRCYPEYLYSSRILPLLVNRILKEGKKTVAQRVVYRAMSHIAKKHFRYPTWVLQKAIRNLMPKVGIDKYSLRVAMGRQKDNKYRRRTERSGDPATPLDCVRIAIFWLVDSTKDGKRGTLGESEKTKPDYRTHKPFHIKLADQIIATSLGKGSAIKKKRALRKSLESLKYYRPNTTSSSYLNNERKK